MRIEAAPKGIDFDTLELLPYGVIVVNAEGTVLFYNNREEEISGLNRADVIGTNFFRDVAPCTEVKEFHGRFLEIMVEGKETVTFAFTFAFALGPREVQINLHPFRKDDESLCIIFVADLTARETLREQLRQAQRYSDLGEVAAKVAHNFNNILQVVQWGAELALESDLEGTRKYLKQVLAATADGSAMVKRYQAIAKSGLTGAGVLCDLNESVVTAVEFARQMAQGASSEPGRKVDLRLNPAGEKLMVLGDAPELREALLNLLRNAIDAIPGEGTVRVLTSREPGWVMVDVIDDGTGMTLEQQSKAFTPLFTTKGDKGTGLGLATVYSTVRRHGGSIRMNSLLGQGTHFRITLPEAR